jgi:hypothetical protein
MTITAARRFFNLHSLAAPKVTLDHVKEVSDFTGFKIIQGIVVPDPDNLTFSDFASLFIPEFETKYCKVRCPSTHHINNRRKQQQKIV